MSARDAAVAVYRKVPVGLRPALKRIWSVAVRLEARRARVLRSVVPTRVRAWRRGPPGPIPSPDGLATPLITVVVPAHDEQRHLDACLRSVARQTHGDFECLVIDDASTDYTLDVAMEWCLADPRFHLVRHRSNLGLSAARNTGLSRARGTYITFLDGDDFLYPRSLERRLDLLAASDDPELLGCYCDWAPVPEDESIDRPARPAVPKPDVNYLSSEGRVPFIATAPVVRVDIVCQLGGFDESLPSAEDFEFWARAMRHGFHFAYVRDVGVAYRQRRSGMVQGSPGVHATVVSQIFDYMDRPLRNDEIVAGTPYVFDAPYASYHADLRRIEKFTNTLALAVATGRDEEIAAVTDCLPLDSWWYASRALDLEGLAKQSLGRVGKADSSFTVSDRDRTVHATVVEIETALRRSRRTPPQELPAPDHDSSADRLPADGSTRGVAIVEPTVRVPAVTVGNERFGGVVLCPMARYHTEELVPLADVLVQRGHHVSFLLTKREEEDVRREMRKYPQYACSLFSWPTLLAELPEFTSVVVLNDWGTKDLVELAHERGVPTFAKVEGVQDFEDLDTGRPRHAYRRAPYVLCQGENDRRALKNQKTYVVGNSRLEQLALGPERCFTESSRSVVINSNFTYNVLTEARDDWIDTALRAARLLSMDPQISQHHADAKLRSGLPIAPEPMKNLLQHADVLVSRFSTVPFESMARGVPFVYHNPHGEKVPTFHHPGDAFRVTTEGDELRCALAEAREWRGSYRARSAAFFAAQVSIDSGTTSAERSAEVIDMLLQDAPAA